MNRMVRNSLLIAAGFIAVTAAILYTMGQPLICKCGYVKLWHGVVVSSENSQHLSDWYTPSHIIHGILFFGFFTLILSTLVEVILSALLAPIMMVIQSGAVVNILSGRDTGWNPQRRDDGSIPLRDIVHRHRECLGEGDLGQPRRYADPHRPGGQLDQREAAGGVKPVQQARQFAHHRNARHMPQKLDGFGHGGCGRGRLRGFRPQQAGGFRRVAHEIAA